VINGIPIFDVQENVYVMEFLDGSGNGTPGLFWNKVAKLHLDYFLFIIITIINIFLNPRKTRVGKKLKKLKRMERLMFRAVVHLLILVLLLNTFL